MLKKYSYKTHGTCSRQIDVTLDGDVVSEVVFHNGCMGNTQGVAALVKGMKAEEAVARLSGEGRGSRRPAFGDRLRRERDVLSRSTRAGADRNAERKGKLNPNSDEGNRTQ